MAWRIWDTARTDMSPTVKMHFLYKWHLFMGMMRMNSGGGQGIYCRGGGMHGRRKSGTERADAGYISQTDVPKNEGIHAHFFIVSVFDGGGAAKHAG